MTALSLHCDGVSAAWVLSEVSRTGQLALDVAGKTLWIDAEGGQVYDSGLQKNRTSKKREGFFTNFRAVAAARRQVE